jgi:hypothetical protein
MEICNERETKPSALLSEIITEWVLNHTPKTVTSKLADRIERGLYKHKRALYTIFTLICFMFLIAVFIVAMLSDKSSIYVWSWFFALVVCVLLFAKIFYMIGLEGD